MKPDARLWLGAGDAALFASDMHLGDHDPDTAAQFLASLAAHTAPAASITHVFLLGDLFEAWVGDDQPDRVAAGLGLQLSALSARGVRVALMRGNRDFLLGVEPAQSGAPELRAGSPPAGAAPDGPVPEGGPTDTVADRRPAPWPARHGARLLEEPTLIDLFGKLVLLAHGDAWCTDDHRYQRFRAEVRSPEWQRAFLAKPLAERLKIAREMRAQSELNKAEHDIGDINEDAVRTALAAAGVRCVIHGHTHRPGCYRLESPASDRLDTTPAERWVLTDWLARDARGGWLRVDETGWARLDS